MNSTDQYYISPTGRASGRYNSRILKEDNSAKYADFLEKTKRYYLSEALNFMLNRCLATSEHDNCGLDICRQFVQEEGYNNLMRNFKCKTYTLALVEQCVSEAVERTKNKTDKDNCITWTIRDSDQKEFYDSLRDLPIDKITTIINKRVCTATEDFIQNNINMKLDIEEVAAKSKERIDAAKEKYDEKRSEQIQKEQTRIYKGAVAEIKNNHTNNIYGHMMNLTSKAILENESIRKDYICESGKIDMGAIESKVKTMYTFLEMVNSFRIKTVDNKYIEECLASIK